MAKILIVDDEMRIRDLLRKALTKEGFEVASVPTAEQSFEVIFKEPFDLLIIDARLAGESGLSVLKKVREHRKNIPIIIYSGVLTSELEKEAREAGADEVLGKDVDILQLVARIKELAKTKERVFQAPADKGKKSLLIVDDEEGVRRVLREYFKRKGFYVIEAESGEQALQVIRVENVSVVLLDIRMPGMDGLEILRRMIEINPNLGVVMVTAEQDDEKIRIATESGAYSYVLKPFDFAYLELVIMSRLSCSENERA